MAADNEADRIEARYPDGSPVVLVDWVGWSAGPVSATELEAGQRPSIEGCCTRSVPATAGLTRALHALTGWPLIPPSDAGRREWARRAVGCRGGSQYCLVVRSERQSQ